MIKGYNMVEWQTSEKLNLSSHQEAQRYFKQFIQQIPERLKILREILQSTGYDSKKLDYSPESLIYLGEWFAKHIAMRKMTKEEIRLFKQKYSETIKKGGLEIPLKEIVKVPKKILTEETESLGHDVGIYFAQVLQKNMKGLDWNVVLKPKNNVYYHQPVLEGFGGSQFHPRSILGTLALRIIEHKQPSSILKKTYDNWAPHEIVECQKMMKRG